MVRLSYASYRLLFRHPFGTAHGMRDGTDAVFVRLEGHGATGYGEATMPPYVGDSADSVISYLRDMDPTLLERRTPETIIGRLPEGSPAGRSAIGMAVIDLHARMQGRSVASVLGCASGTNVPTMATIGHTKNDHIKLRINELPKSAWIKLKLGSGTDERMLEIVQRHDPRPLFLDANQAWGSVPEARSLIACVDASRLAGVEQPFKKDRWDLHGELQAMVPTTVYGDESIQEMQDLDRAAGTFGGVNLKLMKCGGMDKALLMAKRARALGMKVMLGCMSESSLGCSAMAQLQGEADAIDLDGPWLIGNDPFKGLGMTPEGMVMEGMQGSGVELLANLDWIMVGA